MVGEHDMTKIEWCDETINPLQDKIKGASGRGYHCTKVSPGCTHCYAEGINRRFGNGLPFDSRKAEFELIQSEIEKPMRWKKPKRIFVQSMGDLFHEDVPQKTIAGIMLMIAGFDSDAMVRKLNNWPEHQFIILTKRPKRMFDFFTSFKFQSGYSLSDTVLSNLCVGVTCENQEQADKRIPLLLQIQAAVYLVSHEPALGDITYPPEFMALGNRAWLINGGESGAGARPMHPDIPRHDRDQCQGAGMPYFFKQWGEWLPNNQFSHSDILTNLPGKADAHHWTLGETSFRVGKKSAGRLLDGKEWSEFPK